MQVARLFLYIVALIIALILGAYVFAIASSAQTRIEQAPRPDMQRALKTRAAAPNELPRKGGHATLESNQAKALRPVNSPVVRQRAVAHHSSAPAFPTSVSGYETAPAAATRIGAGTPLSLVLHTSQLSNTSSAGTDEQYFDRTGDLVADERTTFDASGGSFDIALGRSGARYEVYTATLSNVAGGYLTVALDTNGDYVRDSSSTYDLGRDFNLPSAGAVVSGTSKAGREFVIVSSSGYYNRSNPNDPNNEPTAGVVLLVRDPNTGGFDNTRSRELVRVGSNQLNNANALALLPDNDLLIADFDSDELRIVRDTNSDGIPDTLDNKAYYSYRFSNDAPLDIAVNSRGVVFSHSYGNNAVMLALYDDNNDGYADTDEVVVEGLSLDNNLFLHGLTVDREGNVYVIEDASGASDTAALGGNGGTPLIDAFPDPALNGFLRDRSLYAVADLSNSQSLTGLAFGMETILGPVGHLTLTNSASQRGPATHDGLASINGSNLTRGASGATEADALSRGLSVYIEGRQAQVFSFNDSQVNIYVPDATGAGTRSVVVYLNGYVIAADDVTVAHVNPGIFTIPQTGAGEAVALLTNNLRYTRGPFDAKTDRQPSVIAIFGTGWRNGTPVNVTIGGRSAVVEYSGPSGGFPGLDQLNARIPEGTTPGPATVIVTTASGATSRTDVSLTIK
ncbi:MAG TPA: IPT/TIG domain-containing protein [Pyrinomonadaceae bacterium]|jgi:uncharacterized protein (TIGR03437 family)|nr:IPT/TIG domain-containing protein [Pyrinomonadaceae bacterium]